MRSFLYSLTRKGQRSWNIRCLNAQYQNMWRSFTIYWGMTGHLFIKLYHIFYRKFSKPLRISIEGQGTFKGFILLYLRSRYDMKKITFFFEKGRLSCCCFQMKRDVMKKLSFKFILLFSKHYLDSRLQFECSIRYISHMPPPFNSILLCLVKGMSVLIHLSHE